MTPTATTLDPRSMIAVSKDSAIKPLGYIVWFSVPDVDVSLRRVRRIWQIAGLDPAPLPSEPREVDSFRRAVRDEEGRVTLPNGDIMETDVRDIQTTDGYVVYQVSRVIRDRDKQLVDYPKALRVKYSRASGEVEYEALSEVDRSEVLPIMEAIQARFEANAKTITGAKVRGLIRQYLKDDDDERAGLVGLGAENMRGKAGGVYFVLAKYVQQIAALAEFLDELYENHESAKLYYIPLADGATERDMIRRQHAANSIAEIEAALVEARALFRDNRKRDIRENVRQHHYLKLERLKRHAAAYASALEEEQENLKDHLEVLGDQLESLLGL